MLPFCFNFKENPDLSKGKHKKDPEIGKVYFHEVRI